MNFLSTLVESIDLFQEAFIRLSFFSLHSLWHLLMLIIGDLIEKIKKVILFINRLPIRVVTVNKLKYKRNNKRLGHRMVRKQLRACAVFSVCFRELECLLMRRIVAFILQSPSMLEKIGNESAWWTLCVV